MSGTHDEWLEVVVDAATAELAAWRLWDAGAVAVEERELSDGSILLVAGFADRDGLDAALAVVGSRAEVRTDDGAWRSTWKRFAEPYLVSARLQVVPSWRSDVESVPSTVRVVIDPGDAFGLEHATTKACLALLVEHVRADVSLLDVGCGSGILAVAAACLGAGSVVACDLDTDAVSTTADNARRNAVTVRTRVGSVGADDGPFDVVVANLGGAHVVVALAARLVAATAPGGLLIIGGVLAEHDGPAVEALRAAAPGASIEAVEADPWRTFVVRWSR